MKYLFVTKTCIFTNKFNSLMFDFCFLSIKFLIYKILSFEILKLNLYYRSMIVNSSIQLQCRIVYDFYFFKYENTLYISYFSNPMISIWSDHEHYSKMSLQFIFIILTIILKVIERRSIFS